MLASVPEPSFLPSRPLHNNNIHIHIFATYDYNMGEFEALPAFVKETLREKAIDCKPIGRQRGTERVSGPCFPGNLLSRSGRLHVRPLAINVAPASFVVWDNS